MERTNLGDECLLSLTPKANIAVADLSYLSLRKAIPLLAQITELNCEMVCLVKPLFEIHDSQVCRTGKVPEPLIIELLRDIIASVHGMGLQICGVCNSLILGSNNTREFFLHVIKGQSIRPVCDVDIQSIVKYRS